MTIVGCYSMDLYCRKEETCARRDVRYPSRVKQWQFNDNTEALCRRQARKVGWRFSGGDVECPECIANRKAHHG